MGQRLRNRIGRILLVALAWTGIGVVFAQPYVLKGGGYGALFATLFNWWLWGLVTPLMLAIDRRLPYPDSQLPQRVGAHLLAGLLIVPTYVFVGATVEYLTGMNKWNPLSQPAAVLDWFLWSWLVYCLILGMLQAYKYYKRYLSDELQMERLERRFAEARLNALRMQLDPHFLFNTLNAISSQVERNPKLARTMIEHLGDLLRLSLESKNRQEIPLSEEVAFLEHYLEIQKLRFGDRLKVDLRIAPEVKYASVPCLFIQPLAENAIRHGLSGRAAGGTLTITAERVDEKVEIRVLDDGLGLPPGWQLETSTGLGLSVTKERIAGLYPDGTSRFVVRPRASGGTEVDISLPLHVIREDTNEPASA